MGLACPLWSPAGGQKQFWSLPPTLPSLSHFSSSGQGKEGDIPLIMEENKGRKLQAWGTLKSLKLLFLQPGQKGGVWL